MKLIQIPAPEFDLEKTLDSGQVFHWDRLGDGFVGTIGDQPIYVDQDGEILRVRDGESPSPAREARALPRIVADYFALDHPLAEICGSFPDDPVMNVARSFCRGLRIIRQPTWECLATFICSSMKQVGHIRQISRKLRERFGEEQKIDPPSVRAGLAQRLRRGGAMVVHAFPTADRIAASSETELRKCALGYRATTLLATARLVAGGDVDLEKLALLSDLDLQKRLCQLPGVGAKVANCVMLFGYERLSAFPIDVWIERVLREKYFPRARKLNAARLQAFTQQYFGGQGGYAQQYLFHHARKTAGRGRTSKATQFVTTPGVR